MAGVLVGLRITRDSLRSGARVLFPAAAVSATIVVVPLLVAALFIG